MRKIVPECVVQVALVVMLSSDALQG
jgi:hypothetical protein